jgi:hypothetical protein
VSVRNSGSSSVIVASIASTTTFNPLLCFGMIDFLQTKSSMIYVNKRRVLKYDNYNKEIYLSHFTTIIPAPSFLKGKSAEKYRRTLDSTTFLDGENSNTNYNPQI